MKILSQNREGNKVTLEIEEEPSKFSAAIAKTLEEAGKEIQVPGFRPGKAPKEMVEKALKRDVLESNAA
ncbi:MAG: trigger factor family protein, partial [Candidatus Margulisbacteria bacterium]|nr:trigger factor family protein [Candidatus Margulisiibacteriota bacterium]